MGQASTLSRPSKVMLSHLNEPGSFIERGVRSLPSIRVPNRSFGIGSLISNVFVPSGAFIATRTVDLWEKKPGYYSVVLDDLGDCLEQIPFVQNQAFAANANPAVVRPNGATSEFLGHPGQLPSTTTVSRHVMDYFNLGFFWKGLRTLMDHFNHRLLTSFGVVATAFMAFQFKDEALAAIANSHSLWFRAGLMSNINRP